MAISKKRIGIHKKKINKSETRLQTIYEIEQESDSELEQNVFLNLYTIMNRIQNNNRLKKSFNWLVFMFFSYYFLNY